MKDCDLIITVDNGISALEASSRCKEYGIDLLITDHHTPPEILPNAYAIVNPKQSDCTFPYSEICGAQVAWYLIASLKETLQIPYNLTKKLDLLSIAIIADMMELKDLNRTMVKSGVRLLNESNRPAFLAIKGFFKKEQIDSDDISFLIAPLINSSGRMDDAMLSYYFLKSRTLDEAYDFLEQIVSHNNQRKEEEQQLFNASLEKIDEDKNIIVVWGDGWHEGVIGIVASRLAKKFHKPSIVFSVDGQRAKGSARSVGSIDILSLICTQEGLLLGYGGHKGAAGMSIEPQNLEPFKSSLESICPSNCINSLRFEDVLGEIDPNDIDFELLEILEEHEPYGQKNSRPLFVLKNLEVKVSKYIGKNENHLKLILQNGGKTLESLFFNFDQKAKRGDFIDIVCNVQKNSFRGLVTPQLLIKEIIHADAN